MNHTTTTTKKNLAIVAMLAAITAALTGTIAISNIQTAAAYAKDPNSNNNNNSTDIEKSTTDFKFKQKEKNNCSGFTGCDNVGTETLVPPPPPCVGTEDLVPPA
jgi:hypothetical protein